MAVDRRRLELDVVDADDLAAVDVDDLLIEQVALEQQRRRRTACSASHCAASVARANRRAGRLQRIGAAAMRSPSAVLTMR